MVDGADKTALSRRALGGVVALGAREGAMRILAFAGDIALYRLLLPEVFGLIVPVAFLAGIIKQFSDVGLAASLIQSPDEPGERDLRTVFTAQAALVAAAAIFIFFAGPLILDALDEGSPDPWLIRAFSLSILLSTFRAVPAAMLERHLRFGRLATADVSGTVWFYAAGIILAAVGAGPWALVAAHVGGSVVPTVFLLFLYPWRPTLKIDRSRLLHNMDFGAKFQGQRILLMLKDSLIPILGPAAFGRSATGFLSWADKIAQQPLILTQLVARVSLPALSRAQGEMETVRAGATLALKWNCLLTFPFFALVFAFAEEIAGLIYGETWAPAVPVLYVLTANAMLVPIKRPAVPRLERHRPQRKAAGRFGCLDRGSMGAGRRSPFGRDGLPSRGGRPCWKPDRRVRLSAFRHQAACGDQRSPFRGVPRRDRRADRTDRFLPSPSGRRKHSDALVAGRGAAGRLLGGDLCSGRQEFA